jgi:hypothetical protein
MPMSGQREPREQAIQDEVEFVLERKRTEPGPATPADLDLGWQAACHLLDWAAADPRRLDRADDDACGEIREWLIELPAELADAGRIDDACHICDEMAALGQSELFLTERALVLATAGRREGAYRQVQDNLSRGERTAFLLRRSGEAYEALGLVANAEELYREALDLADALGDSENAILILDRLAPLLEDRGEDDEARLVRERRETFDLGDMAAQSSFGDATDPDDTLAESAPGGAADSSEARTLARLTGQLIDFSRRPEFETDVATAVHRYWGEPFSRDDLDYVDEDWQLETFFSWLVYDYRRGGGPTFAETFLERRRRLMDDRERHLLERAARSALGLYELVRERDPSVWDVRDLVTGGVRQIDLDPDSEGVRDGDVIAARAIELDGREQLRPGVLGIGAVQREPLLARLAELRAARPNATAEQVLKENGEIFHQMAAPR